MWENALSHRLTEELLNYCEQSMCAGFFSAKLLERFALVLHCGLVI